MSSDILKYNYKQSISPNEMHVKNILNKLRLTPLS
jgi:hypothetical protein